MINKFTLSRVQEIRFVKEHLDEFIANNISLSRYEDDDPLKDIAERNFYATYDYILSHPEVENDYKCLLDLHTMLMKDLDDGIKSELNERQIAELSEMINQPTKANLEIAIRSWSIMAAASSLCLGSIKKYSVRNCRNTKTEMTSV